MKKEDVKIFFSPGAIVRKLSATAVRFPISVAIIAVLAVLLFITIRDDKAVDYRLWIALPMALFASVVFTVGFEEGLERLRRPQRFLVIIVGTLGLVLLSLLYTLFFPADKHAVDKAQTVEIAVIMGSLFFSVFFIAFLGHGRGENRDEGDAAWWNFGVRTLWRLMLGAVFAGILFGGFALALVALDKLLGVYIPDDAYAYLSVLSFVVFAPLYVLAGIPSDVAKHDAEMHRDPVLKVLGLYILAPILAVYTLILYVYLLKILVTWELPNGWVSWLVTVLAMGGLGVTLLLYPLRMRGGNRVVEFMSRWTGVVIVPLLLLMSVGIARRISDYGFTVNRAYILLLNIWFYGVYIYLFAVRGRCVKWILISAVAVAFLSSVGPWSIERIVTPREQASEKIAVGEVENGDNGEFFGSYNMVRDNLLYELDGKYGKFVIIDWHGDDGKDGNFEYTQKGDELLIKISNHDNESDGGNTLLKEVRVPLRESISGGEIRGEDFFLLLINSTGTQYAAQDSIHINQLKGYLFFD